METTKELCITEGRNSTSPSGLSMRRSFSHFTETVFYPARGRTTSPADRTLQVTLYEPSNYESAVQSDFTYEITAKNTSGQGVQWTWRKWPSGTQSFGTYSELHSFSNRSRSNRTRNRDIIHNVERQKRWWTCGNLMPLPVTLFVFAVKHLLMNP